MLVFLLSVPGFLSNKNMRKITCVVALSGMADSAAAMLFINKFVHTGGTIRTF